MDQKYKVGVLFCGGCNCYFDREKLYESLVKTLSDQCHFFYYPVGSGEYSDLIVLINGCQSECLMAETYPSQLLLINNKNYQQAGELIRAALHI